MSLHSNLVRPLLRNHKRNLSSGFAREKPVLLRPPNSIGRGLSGDKFWFWAFKLNMATAQNNLPIIPLPVKLYPMQANSAAKLYLLF